MMVKVAGMIFYDFEVFAHDWLVVFIDMDAEQETVIHNNSEQLTRMYEGHKNTIWAGYNNKHYDQYIYKGIMLGMDPKAINDWIIVQHKEGWQFSRAFNTIPMIQYDCMPNPPVGLKTLESFLGSDVRETEVPFNIDRPLTQEELDQTIYYCRHDVEETIKVFMQRIDVFEAMKGIVEAFPDKVDLSDIGDSEARITAKVLGCVKHDWTDEFEWEFEPCIQLKKYHYVMDWFADLREEARRLDLAHADPFVKKVWYKQQAFPTDIAGVPHNFGFGGLHGARRICHRNRSDGAGYHVDVNNYYPSYLLAHGKVTRSATNDNYDLVYKTRKKMKMAQLAAKTKEEAKEWKRKQLPYKKMLNALSGAMKDATNPAYDPRNNNCMCINGQLMLLDLIEHLEVMPGFDLIQSNTDGLIVWIPDTDAAFQQLDDICYDWECRMSTSKCDIGLALDAVKEIYQRDVNSYCWIEADGSVERIGAVKELSPIDCDLPIVNKAMVDYMVDKIRPEDTVNRCTELKMFQKVVKLSDKYLFVEHEEGRYVEVKTGKRVIKTHYEYPDRVRFTYKCYRTFASTDLHDGRLLKCGGASGKPEKFGGTADHCFIFNDCTDGQPVPDKLDRRWYIDQAWKGLEKFGIERT